MNKQTYDLVFNSFVDDTPSTFKRRPHKIKFGGNFVKLESGKSLWNSIGFAKSALRNHVEQVMYRTKTYPRKEQVDEILAQLYKDGLEFVPFGE